ncbi:cupin domain-containing protein [Natronococcus sp. A-GB1]|uniref:cupin domain-containing protein n=1 Tax=Natronococcus sp. A-GB1 TaxID=3037648 RepID=UPI0024204C14|nr:cupin domain-containing protein [Natronococcus sp. A-GB1]MDG5758042.1 cupin domain-containing protein [Natronococcus sp. A-GB1]
MEYEVVHTDDVPLTDLSEIDEVPSDLQMRAIDDFLPSEHVQLKLWYFEPGEEIRYHAHAEQEELYFALEGEFELTLGRDGDTERREIEAGAFWLARPEVGHGHRNVGDEEGIVLAVGAPNVEDPGRDPGEFDEGSE